MGEQEKIRTDEEQSSSTKVHQNSSSDPVRPVREKPPQYKAYESKRAEENAYLQALLGMKKFIQNPIGRERDLSEALSAANSQTERDHKFIERHKLKKPSSSQKKFVDSRDSISVSRDEETATSVQSSKQTILREEAPNIRRKENEKTSPEAKPNTSVSLEQTTQEIDRAQNSSSVRESVQDNEVVSTHLVNPSPSRTTYKEQIKTEKIEYSPAYFAREATRKQLETFALKTIVKLHRTEGNASYAEMGRVLQNAGKEDLGKFIGDLLQKNPQENLDLYSLETEEYASKLLEKNYPLWSVSSSWNTDFSLTALEKNSLTTISNELGSNISEIKNLLNMADIYPNDSFQYLKKASSLACSTMQEILQNGSFRQATRKLIAHENKPNMEFLEVLLTQFSNFLDIERKLLKGAGFQTQQIDKIFSEYDKVYTGFQSGQYGHLTVRGTLRMIEDLRDTACVTVRVTVRDFDNYQKEKSKEKKLKQYIEASTKGIIGCLIICLNTGVSTEAPVFQVVSSAFGGGLIEMSLENIIGGKSNSYNLNEQPLI